MVKLTYSEHSLWHSHVQLAQVCHKSGEGERLKKKKSNSFSTRAIMMVFWFGLVWFPFLGK